MGRRLWLCTGYSIHIWLPVSFIYVITPEALEKLWALPPTFRRERLLQITDPRWTFFWVERSLSSSCVSVRQSNFLSVEMSVLLFFSLDGLGVVDVECGRRTRMRRGKALWFLGWVPSIFAGEAGTDWDLVLSISFSAQLHPYRFSTLRVFFSKSSSLLLFKQKDPGVDISSASILESAPFCFRCCFLCCCCCCCFCCSHCFLAEVVLVLVVAATPIVVAELFVDFLPDAVVDAVWPLLGLLWNILLRKRVCYLPSPLYHLLPSHQNVSCVCEAPAGHC